MAASLDGDIVLFGGDAQVVQTWTWDGATWAELQPSFSPPPLEDSVFGQVGSDLFLFAGYGGDVFGGIYGGFWRWDGASWGQETPSVLPVPRAGPAGAVLNGSIFVFGGVDASLAPLGDTWLYDGTSWTQMMPAHSPSPRSGALAAAYEGKVVLFGGDSPSPSGFWASNDDTWVWDGVDWTQAQPARSPGARSEGKMVATGGQVVLFSGIHFVGTSNVGTQAEGTWTWDGTNWTEHTGPGPAPRRLPAMASTAGAPR
jgi:hypothetical protein